MEKISKEDQATYDWIMKTMDPSLDNTQVIARYNDWSSTYDEMLGNGRYKGPQITAEEVARMVPETRRQEVLVLDVAAGTGWVGRELQKRGFTNVDAVEPTDGMLKVLLETGAYRHTYQEFLGKGQQSTVAHDTYDVVTCCGSIGDHHVPLQGIEDMIHFAKPGGLVVIASDVLCCQSIETSLTKLESYVDQLEQKGLWRKEDKKMMPNFFFNEEGLFFIYRVL